MHASIQYSDGAFIEEFERCTLPNELFHHEDHLRLAWLYLDAYGSAQAEQRMSQSILRFATSLGAAHKYHHTMTIAWMRLVRLARERTPHLTDFADFSDAHPWLVNRDALLAFYSREVLFGERARSEWVEPDLGHW